MTARKLTEPKIVLATHNPGKVVEIKALLEPFGTDVIAAGDLGLPEPVEDAPDFIGNAKIKALASATASGMPALADDSGLCVNALGGEPGIYSARWAGPSKDFNIAMTRVAGGLSDHEDRSAYFVCALCLAWPDGHTEAFQGEVQGNLVWPARGDRGFGYDPMFVPTGFDITFGEMDPDRKHGMSHRHHAFVQLVDACFKG